MRLLAAILLFVAAVVTQASPTDEDARFGAFVETVLDGYWKLRPEDAFAEGYYKYADRMSIPDAATRAEQVAFADDALRSLEGFDPRRLSVENRVDLVLLRNEFESDRWYLTVFRDWEWQPSQYNVADTFARQLDTEYAPADTRLRHMLGRLERVPAYYVAAKASLSRPTVEDTAIAIEQNRNGLEVFDEGLMRKVQSSGLTDSEKALFAVRVAAARAAIADYVSFLADLKPKLEQGGGRSFRIGKELYAQKFAYDLQSGFTVTELYDKARAEKAALHDRMELLARILWPKYMGAAPLPDDRFELIRAVFDELSKHHTTPARYVETVRQQIVVLEQFVREHDLVEMDPSRPLVVREMPGYMRGFSGAHLVSPGPYDPTAKAFYDVTPLDRDAPERAESYLREYNDWMLQLLSIHEAIPGHYVQDVHANKSKSLVKALFGDPATIEGWAVYGERMMLDAGYGGNAPEMWLTWMKWNLRSVCNTIVDVEVQTGDLTRDRFVSFLKREGFQSEAEATDKWRRATLSQVQLDAYYDGYIEITALRDEEKHRLGKDFSVKAFNTRFLSYGSAPVRYIRELMREPQ